MWYGSETDQDIYTDNQGSIKIAINSCSTKRSKHIDIQFHFTRSVIESGEIELEYCPNSMMIADMMTKALARVKVEEFTGLDFWMESVAKCMKGFERGRLLEMSVTILLSSARDMTRRHNVKMHCWDLNWIWSDQAASAVVVGGAGEESLDPKYKKGLYKQEKRGKSCERK
jgi:hypothetical protein